MGVEGLFYEKKEDALLVKIWTEEESYIRGGVVLPFYNKDVKRLFRSLMFDPAFLKMVKGKTDDEIKTIIEIVLCHNLRLTAREAGVHAQ